MTQSITNIMITQSQTKKEKVRYINSRGNKMDMEMQDADGDEKTGDDGCSPWQAELSQGTRLKGAKSVLEEERVIAWSPIGRLTDENKSV